MRKSALTLLLVSFAFAAFAQIDPGSIVLAPGGTNNTGTTVTVNYGTVPPNINSQQWAYDYCSRQYLSGHYNYEWDISYDGGQTWTMNIANGTSYFPFSGITRTTSYRRAGTALAGTSCPETWAYSNIVTIFVNAGPLTAGTIVTTNTSACANTNVVFSSTHSAAGGTLPLAYQWQQKTTGSFSDIANATSETYTTGYLTENTTFRRKVTDANNNVAYSNEINISFRAVSTSLMGSIVGTLCSLYLIPNTTPSNGVSHRWQKENSSGAFQDVSGAYADGSYTVTTSGKYRVIATDNYCGPSAISNTLTVNILGTPINVTIANGPSVSASCSVRLSAYTNAISYQWQRKDNNNVYQDINGAANGSYTATQSGDYRVVAKGDQCGNYNMTAVSDPTTVTITPFNEVATIANGATASGNCSVALNAVTVDGGSYQWQMKDNSNVFQNINGATSSTYTATQSGSYRFVLTKAVCSSGSAVSAPIDVQVTTSQPVALITNGSTVSGNCSAVLNAQTGTGYSYQWQLKDNNNVFQNIGSATASSYTAFQSGEYRIVVSNTACGGNASATSSATTVTLTTTPPGNPAEFGNNNWRMYAYNGIDQNLDANSYRGYYDYGILFFNNIYEPSEYTRFQSPSYLPDQPAYSSSWHGCPVNVDNFTMVAKRRGFACGTYQIRIRVGENEMYDVYLDGNLIGSGGNPRSSLTYVVLSTTALGANSTIEARVRHFNGQLRFDFEVEMQNPTFTSGVVQPAAAQTITYNTAPIGFTSSTNPTSLNGPLTYQWEKALAVTGPWTAIPNATNITYTSPALLQTTYFRRTASNGTCEGPKYTNNIIINVTNIPAPSLDGGTITPSATSICNNYNGLAVNSTTPATGGTAPYSYSWEQKNASGSFVPVASAFNAVLNLGNISATTTFKRKVTDAAGNTAYSNEVTIYKLEAGSIAPSTQTINTGTSVSILSATLAGGNNSPITYQWQNSSAATGSWNNMVNETGSAFQSAPLNQAQYYRRLAITSTCPEGAPSNVSEVLIRFVLALEAGEVSPLSAPCITAGNAPALLTATPASGGGTPYIYTWQKNDNGTWVDIPGTNTQNYQPGPIGSTTSFRRMVTDNYGTVAYSNQITLNAQGSTLKAGLIDAAQVACTGAAAGNISSVLDACGGNGSLAYAWEYSIVNGVWATINNAAQSTYYISSLNASTKFRRKVTDGCNSSFYSNAVEVLVYPTIEAGTVYPSTQTVCINEPKQPLALMQGCHYVNGTVTYQWQQSETYAGPWTDIPNATNASYLPISPNPSVYYRLRVSSTTCNAVTYSNTALVMIAGCYISKAAPAPSLTAATSIKAGIKVYPNPAVQGQSVTVMVDGTEGNYRAILKGTDGRTYNCTVNASSKGQIQVKLPSPMGKGVYLIQVSNNKQQWTEKLLVQ